MQWKFWKSNLFRGRSNESRDRSSDVKPDARTSFDVEDVIQKVKIAVTKANVVGREARDAIVASITLNLQVVQELKAGGEVRWTVPVIGLELGAAASTDRSATSAIEINLIAPPPEAAIAQGLLPEIDVVRDLEQAIKVIRRGIVAGATGDPPFVLGAASVELAFAVTVGGGISLVATADRSKSTTNTLKLNLERPSLSPDPRAEGHEGLEHTESAPENEVRALDGQEANAPRRDGGF